MGRGLCIVLSCITVLSLFVPVKGAEPNAVLASTGLARSPLAPEDIFCIADTSRGKEYMKDPSVVRLDDTYFMYVSLPPHADRKKQPRGWRGGIFQSDDLINWKKAGEIHPEGDYESKGLAAPDAMVYDGKVHLFYQSYGNGRADAICHAVSEDGIHFKRNPTNPIFRPTGDWNCGRAIDAETVIWKDKIFLYWATRTPDFKIQMQGVSSAPLSSKWERDDWTQACDEPILNPELPWEYKCIEAATICEKYNRLYMFYAGGYNNNPQQVGIAVSDDGIKWTRMSDKPIVARGAKGEWNRSESGHPGVFVDNDGQTYLFYQGNADRGRSWYIACKRIGWEDGKPVVLGDLKIKTK